MPFRSDSLQGLWASLSAAWQREHRADGQHGNVSAGTVALRTSAAALTPNLSTVYADSVCKAWALVTNTSGTPVLTAGYNVDSITDNGTGDYTVNFIQPMTSTSYAVAPAILDRTGNQKAISVKTLTRASFGIETESSTGAAEDHSFMVIVFGP